MWRNIDFEGKRPIKRYFSSCDRCIAAVAGSIYFAYKHFLLTKKNDKIYLYFCTLNNAVGVVWTF